MTLRKFTPLIAALALVSACAANEVEEGATAIARLSVVNSGVLVAVLLADTTCGFGSDAVRAAPLVVGALGSPGSATYSVESCTLDFDDAPPELVNCAEETTRLAGAVTVTATLTIEGTITGDDKRPVFPRRADSTTLTVSSAIVDRFRPEVPGVGASLEFVEGTIAFVARPRLAVAASTGLCTAPTGDIEIVGLGLDNVGGRIRSDDEGDAPIFVRSAAIDAVIGRVGERENMYGGTIDLAFGPLDLPVDGAQALDPDYDRTNFERQSACGDLKVPIDDMCDRSCLEGPVSPECDALAMIADASARTAPAAFATVIQLLESDDRCGFNSPEVVAGVQTDGLPGSEGTATFGLPRPCVIDVALGAVVARDCLGVQTHASGRVTARGTRRVFGFLTGSPAKPVIPTRRDATVYDLQLNFEDFTVERTAAGAPKFSIAGGELSGQATIRAALDTTTGACTVGTPTIRFDGLTHTNATVRLTEGGVTLALDVDSSTLAATSGPPNLLSGTLVANGRTFTVPSDGQGLDPAFDPDAFVASFVCGDVEVPADEAACSFRAALAPAVAALLVQDLAVAATLSFADNTCGFMSPLATSIAAVPPTPVGAPPVLGFVTTGIDQCVISPPTDVPIAEDCLRNRTVATGAFTVTATRTITGVRTEQCMGTICIQLAAPVTRDAIDVTASRLAPTDFSASVVEPGGTTPSRRLTLSGGEVAFEVVPILGENALSAGLFDIPTPVLRFRRVRASGVAAVMFVDGLRFDVGIDASDFAAATGFFEGQGNRLSGVMTLDGQTVALMHPLDPTYRQTVFDLSYDCTPNLVEAVPPN